MSPDDDPNTANPTPSDDNAARGETAPADATQPGMRRWPAIAILVLAAVSISLLQFTPGEQFPDQFRNFLTIVVSAAAIVGLLVWLALFSRLGARRRAFGIVAALAILAIPVTLVRSVEFTGDIVPSFTFRWDPDPLDILEAHRLQASKAPALDAPTEDLNADFPAFRGADRSGVYHGAAIRTNWDDEPPKTVWRQPVGEGYAQIVLSGNLAITIEQRGDKEAIVAYDARTGRERWVYDYPTRFSEAMGGDGPRATPTLVDDRVYALGANGHLTCLDVETGEKIWQTNILADPEANNFEWGMAGSPLVLDDLLIVNPGMPHSAAGKALVAYDRKTGEVVWGVGDSAAAYASPVYAEIAGVPQILTLEASGAAGYAADGSGELWRYPWETQSGINCSQPQPAGNDRVLITAGYVMGSTMLQINHDPEKGWSAEPLWEERSLRGKFCTPIITEGAIFGLDEGVLVCIDPETGKRLWKRGRYGHGQLLLAGDVLFIQAEDGDVAVVAADPDEYRELARVAVFDGRTWNTPALAAGRAFLRNHREMACLDLRADAE